MPVQNNIGYQNPYGYNYQTQTYSSPNYAYGTPSYTNPYSLIAPNVPNQQSQQNAVGDIWVYSEEEVNRYPVAPNNAVRFWNANVPIVYLKQADASGKPTVKAYDLVERNTSNTSSEAPQIKKDYVTKEELNNVVQTMGSVTSVLESIRNDINTMKDDMYGIAGKKKTGRKSEVESTDE